MADIEGAVFERLKKNEENTSEMLPPELPGRTEQKPTVSENEEIGIYPPDKEEEFPEIPYKEPAWSGLPGEVYNLELLKSGCIISTVDLTTKPYYLFGRLPNCDVVMEHPTISRYHAVLQYKASQSAKSEQGFYLYDLGSTHGTKINKVAIERKRYYRIRVGYVIKFGGSTRLYILQGPEEPEEDELLAIQEETKPEVGQVMTEEELEQWKQKKTKKIEDYSEGIDWGMGEDAVEDDPVYPSGFGDQEKDAEEHQFKDPKKTLRGYFEREGLELEYEVEETGPEHAKVFHCRVKLPIEMASGDSLYAEAMITGKKKEAVLACATDACRILDSNGLLRESAHESKKHKEKNWEENDFYDSDEDTFLDRTGSIEKKRVKRMKLAGKTAESVETFETLNSRLQNVVDNIKSLEEKLQQAMQALKCNKDGGDSLDSYMSSIGTTMDKNVRMQIRRKIFDLKKEKQGLAKLVNISRPASLPELTRTSQTNSKVPEIKNEGSVSPVKSHCTSTEHLPTPTVDQSTDYRHEVESEGNIHSQAAGNTDVHQEPKHEDLRQHCHDSITSDVQEESSSEKIKSDKNTGFAMPALPAFKKQRLKATPVGSISHVLEEIHGKGQTGGGEQCPPQKRESKPVSHSKKESSDNEKDKDQEPPEKKKKKKQTYGAPTEWEAESDPTFSSWLPPSDQSGDGRTKLNDKYGY